MFVFLTFHRSGKWFGIGTCQSRRKVAFRDWTLSNRFSFAAHPQPPRLILLDLLWFHLILLHWGSEILFLKDGGFTVSRLMSFPSDIYLFPSTYFQDSLLFVIILKIMKKRHYLVENKRLLLAHYWSEPLYYFSWFS